MRFSVIVPVYNVASYLNDCLRSLESQSFSDFEIVCVNDGSTDNSEEILNSHSLTDKRIRIVNQANQGLSVARNAGISESCGEYVLFLDSDDWLEPNALQVLNDNLGGEDMLCFNGRRYFESIKQYEPADILKPEEGLSGWDYYCRHALETRHFAFVCVVLRCYRREFLLHNNLLFKPGIYHEDNLFTPIACYYAKKVKVIPDVLYDYRVRGSSITTTKNIKHQIDLIGIANELSDFFKDKAIEKTTLYRSMTHHYQKVFSSTGQEEDKILLPLVNWSSYRMVSRTKRRHRIQYAAMRISPALFRMINKH